MLMDSHLEDANSQHSSSESPTYNKVVKRWSLLFEWMTHHFPQLRYVFFSISSPTPPGFRQIRRSITSEPPSPKAQRLAMEGAHRFTRSDLVGDRPAEFDAPRRTRPRRGAWRMARCLDRHRGELGGPRSNKKDRGTNSIAWFKNSYASKELHQSNNYGKLYG